MTTNDFLISIEKTYTTCQSIVKKKNADYAGLDDPFKNFKNSEVIGISVEQGIMVRLMDKITRISNLLKREREVKDETIQDTIVDAINYLAILKSWTERNSDGTNTG